MDDMDYKERHYTLYIAATTREMVCLSLPENEALACYIYIYCWTACREAGDPRARMARHRLKGHRGETWGRGRLAPSIHTQWRLDRAVPPPSAPR
jgi:hypothetical protein